MRRVTAAVIPLVVLLVACSGGDGEEAGPSTTVTTTTLPPPSSTTTLPDRGVTEVDVCELLNDADLETVLDDAGPGEATLTEEVDADDGVPAFVAGACSWPSVDEPALVLNYLAPTTAADGPTHLRDVLATGTGFAEGGQVITQEAGQQTIGLLLDDQRQLREAAIAKRSALLYLLVNQEVSGADPEALTAYAELMVAALSRAPR